MFIFFKNESTFLLLGNNNLIFGGGLGVCLTRKKNPSKTSINCSNIPVLEHTTCNSSLVSYNSSTSLRLKLEKSETTSELLNFVLLISNRDSWTRLPDPFPQLI